MDSTPPRRTISIRRSGKTMRTYPAVIDAIRQAQRSGTPLDAPSLDAAAEEALAWLDDILLDAAFASVRKW